MRRALSARSLGLLLGCAAASNASAQSPVLLMGRIEDAVSAEPVPGVRVTAGDAARSVFTNSLGHFAIQVPGPAPFVVSAVREGYEPTTFELPMSATSEVAVLALEPALLLAGFVAPDDRIRISSPDVSGEFWVARVRSDALVLRHPDSAMREVPTTSLRTLEVSRGRQTSHLKGVFGGAFIGGLVGGVLGVQCIQTHYDCVTGVSIGPSTVIGASVGALTGLIVARVSGEVWEEVRLPNAPSDEEMVEDFLASRPEAAAADPVGGGLEMTVRNGTSGPLAAYVWWEGGGAVPLGEVGAGSTRTFRSTLRSSGVALFVEVLSDPGLNPRRDWRRPSSFILVQEGERLQWTVLQSTSGIVDDYFRVTDR